MSLLFEKNFFGFFKEFLDADTCRTLLGVSKHVAQQIEARDCIERIFYRESDFIRYKISTENFPKLRHVSFEMYGHYEAPESETLLHLDCFRTVCDLSALRAPRLEVLGAGDLRQATALNADLPNLRSLDISFSDVAALPATFLLLEVCNVSFTPVLAIPSVFVNITTLLISGTDITAIPHLPALEILHADGCVALTEIPPTLTALRELSVNATEISEIPKTLTSLVTLECANNPFLLALPKELEQLEQLNCSCTIIDAIPKTFKNLKILKAFDTYIEDIPATFEALEHLDIRDAPVKHLEPMQHLAFLDCFNTKVPYLPHFPQLELLYASSNARPCLLPKLIYMYITPLDVYPDAPMLQTLIMDGEFPAVPEMYSAVPKIRTTQCNFFFESDSDNDD